MTYEKIVDEITEFLESNSIRNYLNLENLIPLFRSFFVHSVEEWKSDFEAISQHYLAIVKARYNFWKNTGRRWETHCPGDLNSRLIPQGRRFATVMPVYSFFSFPSWDRESDMHLKKWWNYNLDFWCHNLTCNVRVPIISIRLIMNTRIIRILRVHTLVRRSLTEWKISVQSTIENFRCVRRGSYIGERNLTCVDLRCGF